MSYAFVFPGQGAQYVGMGRAMAEAYPAAAEIIARADEALGRPLSQLLYEGPSEELTLTWNTQPAILTVSIACLEALKGECDLSPVAVAGHSLGEYSALVAAGAMDFEDAVRTVEKRGRFMQAAVPVGVGAMYAVLGLDADKLAALCEEVSGPDGLAAVANDNCPGQVVISGSAKAVEQVAVLAKEAGAKRAVPLNVSAPFHCTLMDPAAKKLSGELGKIAFKTPTAPVVTNVDAKAHSDADGISDRLVQQVSGAVLWNDCVKTLSGMGVDKLVEIGPGKVLSGLTRRIDRSIGMNNIEDPDSLKAFVEGL
jgi:[acyl-carrier-protein] S-malonyltransferase